MSGIFITSGMTLRIPAGGIRISLNEEKVSPIVAEVSLDTWDHWLDIANESLQQSKSAHTLLIQAIDNNSDNKKSSALEAEFKASLTSMSATAFAMDALYASIKERIPASNHPPTSQGKKTPRYALVTEMIRRGFRLTNEQSQQLRKILKELYKFRDWAVHPPGDFRQPILHPDIDAGVEWRFIAYSASNAKKIYDAIMQVLTLLFQRVRPGFDDLEKWANACNSRLTQDSPRSTAS
ncbi:hypothetical protein ACH35V_40680 [Actinomadura sp. 1N219]|uniref:hypothetical protein n=1 Tax=Actinomadura sp. 1N219 TaxID=3375152 RepID=UPI0037ACB504